jgi:hypothetical protein
MAGIAALIVLLFLVSRGLGFGSGGGAWIVLAVTAVGLLAWLAPVPSAAIEPGALWILAIGVGVAVAGLHGPRRAGRLAAWTVVVGAAVVSIHAVYQKLWGLDRLARAVAGNPNLPDHVALMNRIEEGRAFASFTTPAGLAGYLALALPLTVGLAIEVRGRSRWLALTAASLQLAGLFSAASATATAALLVALGLAAVAAGVRSRAVWVALGVTALLLLTIVVSRDSNVVIANDPTSPWRLRAGNFRAASQMAHDHAWTGVGPGGFSEFYPGYRRAGDNEVRHAHNLPLELMAETGWIAGGLLALTFFLLFLSPLTRAGPRGPARRGVAVGLAAFALHNLGDYTGYMASVLVTACLLLGLELAPEPRPERKDPGRSNPGWTLAATAVLLVVAALASLSSLSQNAQLLAREAAFAGDPVAADLLAVRAYRLAPWDVDAALLRARTHGAGSDPRSWSSEERAEALARAERAVSLSAVRPAAREVRARARLSNADLAGAYADSAEAARLYPLETGYAELRDRLAARIAGQRSVEAAP